MDLEEISDEEVRKQLSLLGFQNVDDNVVNKYAHSLKSYHFSPNRQQENQQTTDLTELEQQQQIDQESIDEEGGQNDAKEQSLFPSSPSLPPQQSEPPQNSENNVGKTTAYEFFFGHNYNEKEKDDRSQNVNDDSESIKNNKYIEEKDENELNEDDSSKHNISSVPYTLEQRDFMERNGLLYHQQPNTLNYGGSGIAVETVSNMIKNEEYPFALEYYQNLINNIVDHDNDEEEDEEQEEEEEEEEEEVINSNNDDNVLSNNMNVNNTTMNNDTVKIRKKNNNKHNKKKKKKRKLSNNVLKCDPVSLFQSFEYLWKKDKFLNKKTTRQSQRFHALSMEKNIKK